MNEHGDILPYTPMKKIFNLRWYIQHLMAESEDEAQNPLCEQNWMKQNNCKFIKYVIYHRHPMTPEQLKQRLFEEIFKNQHEKVDTDEGESNINEQESTISIKEEDEYSTSSDILKKDSESDINIDDTQDQQNSQTPETLQNNTTIHNKDDLIHDEYDTSEDENITEIETYEDFGEKIHETEESIPTETSQVLTVFNKAIHHEDDTSDDKSVIEIEPPRENGEQELENRANSLLPNFKLKLKTEKLKGS